MIARLRGSRSRIGNEPASGTTRRRDVNPGISIRAAAPEDWPAIWQFMRRIVAAGETFS